jgi:hypothetical protein
MENNFKALIESKRPHSKIVICVDTKKVFINLKGKVTKFPVEFFDGVQIVKTEMEANTAVREING